MRIKHKGDGSIILHVGGAEAAFLRNITSELRAQINHPDFTRRIMRRLFPRYADDDKTNDELRNLLFDEQRRQKLARADAFIAELSKISQAGSDVKLSPQETEHWLALLTDLRFVYAAAVGIDEADEADTREIEPTREFFIYEYLTGLQQMLLGPGLGFDEDPGWMSSR